MGPSQTLNTHLDYYNYKFQQSMGLFTWVKLLIRVLVAGSRLKTAIIITVYLQVDRAYALVFKEIYLDGKFE